MVERKLGDDLKIDISKMSPSAQMSFKYLHPEIMSNNDSNVSSKFKEPTKQQLSNSILKETKRLLSRYIETSSQNIEILALWLIGTYFHNEFETYPLLQLLAQKRSGKSRTLKLVSSLAYGSDGSISTSPTETLLFRHKIGALFFDEMENISSKERGAFRETLNAVYKKGNKIIRYKEAKNKEGNKDYVEDCFYPYYPIGLANISGIGDVLQDRTLQVVLRRSKASKTKLVEDFKTNKDIINLKEVLNQIDAKIPQNLLSEWNNYIENKEMGDNSLKEIFDKINSTEISGRAFELFLPLFIISYLAGDIDNFLQVAKDYVSQKEEEEAVDDVDEILKNFLNSKRLEYLGFIPTSKILSDFRNSLETPEEWVNSKWFGRALKRLDFISKKRLVNGKVQIILKDFNINTTNTTNPTNSTNTTNTTKKEVELVEYVESKGLVGDRETLHICKNCGSQAIVKVGEDRFCYKCYLENQK